MPLGLAATLAVIGAAALMFSAFGRWEDKREWRVALCVAGLLILPAALVYILLVFIFLDAV